MNYYTTKDRKAKFSLEQAVNQGLAADGGLFMPDGLEKINPEFFANIENLTFSQIAFEVARHLLKGDIDENDLKKITDDAFNFELPIKEIEPNKFVMELFHGPTLAFKDFGARFMARLMSYFLRQSGKEVIILVATSGDTGSAVGQGFVNVPGVRVILLYPSGKISKIQEQQLTTIGNNIFALEVEGVFDDCQNMVKKAFVDSELISKFNLSSANSINIARLIPQSFYYFYAYAQLKKYNKPLVISVPSGNLGNLTAGLIAYKLGLPVHKFVASNNSNDAFAQYVNSGEYKPKSTIPTISNAMDVGNPNNFPRILDLFDNDYDEIKKIIEAYTFSDEETISLIKEVNESKNYLLDPHSAVAVLGLKKFMKNNSEVIGLALSTAHPAKFGDVLKEKAEIKVAMPKQLEECLNKPKVATKIKNEYADLKSYLIENF